MARRRRVCDERVMPPHESPEMAELIMQCSALLQRVDRALAQCRVALSGKVVTMPKKEKRA
jgi:hypothetical protein